MFKHSWQFSSALYVKYTRDMPFSMVVAFRESFIYFVTFFSLTIIKQQTYHIHQSVCVDLSLSILFLLSPLSLSPHLWSSRPRLSFTCSRLQQEKAEWKMNLTDANMPACMQKIPGRKKYILSFFRTNSLLTVICLCNPLSSSSRSYW